MITFILIYLIYISLGYFAMRHVIDSADCSMPIVMFLIGMFLVWPGFIGAHLVLSEQFEIKPRKKKEKHEDM